jgi:hypothetical protein
VKIERRAWPVSDELTKILALKDGGFRMKRIKSFLVLGGVMSVLVSQICLAGDQDKARSQNQARDQKRLQTCIKEGTGTRSKNMVQKRTRSQTRNNYRNSLRSGR